MKRFILAAAIALLGVAGAQAQTNIAPNPTHGCGTMSVTTTSAQIVGANVTLCPGVNAFPLTSLGLTLTVANQPTSTASVYLCPFGGTCATVGQLLAAGAGVTKVLPFASIPPTVISVSGTQTI